jgi:hypothetical protein
MKTLETFKNDLGTLVGIQQGSGRRPSTRRRQLETTSGRPPRLLEPLPDARDLERLRGNASRTHCKASRREGSDSHANAPRLPAP